MLLSWQPSGRSDDFLLNTGFIATAIALYTGQGEFGLALALGIILLVLALLVNVVLQVLQGKAHA